MAKTYGYVTAVNRDLGKCNLAILATIIRCMYHWRQQFSHSPTGLAAAAVEWSTQQLCFVCACSPVYFPLKKFRISLGCETPFASVLGSCFSSTTAR